MEQPSFAASEFQPEVEPAGNSVRETVENNVAAPNPSFGNLQNTLNSLRAHNENIGASLRNEPQMRQAVGDSAVSAGNYAEPKFENSAQLNSAAAPKQESDEDLVYPFGGWTDESNYHG
jgi:hypothetical protein